MPKQKAIEMNCRHFRWRLRKREGVWYADGRRQGSPNPGRHSLGTRDLEDARKLVVQLDAERAVVLGLAPASAQSSPVAPLSLTEGRKLFEAHYGRSRTVGGVAPATKKRYRAHLDNFFEFCETQRIQVWNTVTDRTLEQYSNHLEHAHYAPATIAKELRLIKEAVNWLIKEGILGDKAPIKLLIRKERGCRAYCWRQEEVTAMVHRCRQVPELGWLGDVIVALTCTGMRISELCSLRWQDIDLGNRTVNIVDESGFPRGRQAGPTTKNRRNRSVPIHDALASVLAGLRRTSNGLIFHGPRGGRLKADTVRRVLFRDVLKPLENCFPTSGQGFMDGRLHSFRHFFVSSCISQGIDVEQVKLWVGHSDSEMVRHYYHCHASQARDRMNRLTLLDAAGGSSVSAERAEPAQEADAPPQSS